MTETLLPPPSETPPAPPPGIRLVRDPSDKVLAGVCAGLGRSTGTDPVLWRVLIAVLALFGGAGILLYLLGWLLVPRAGAPESFLERVVRGGSVPTATAAVLGVLAVVGLAAVSGDDGTVPLALLVFGAIAFLAVRDRTQVPAPAPVPPAPHVAWGEPVTAAPRRPRSPLGPLTLSAAVLAVGLLLVAGEAGLDGVTPVRVLSSALLVVGAGLVVGTWYGRARWLLLPGLLLALAAVSVAVVQGPYGWTLGERTWIPATDARQDYRLGAGEATLDLRGLEPGEVPEVRAQVGAGHLVVLVPGGLPVRLRTDVEAGEVVQTEPDGSRTDLDETALSEAGPGRPTVLDLSLRAGQIEVRRVAA